MPATVGGGIASGITNAIALGLRAEGNEMRRDRTEALERASGNKLALDLEKFEFTKSQAQTEFEAGQPERDLRKIELQREDEEKKKKENWLTVQGHMEDRYGKNFTPKMIEKYRIFLDFMLVGKARDGIYNEFDVDQALASAFDTENPNIGGAEKLRDYFGAGSIETDEQIEVREQKFGKIAEKNQLIAKGNAAAIQDDPKAAELAQSIPELKQANNQFRSLGAEVDDFVIRQKEEKKRQRALKRERISSMVGAIQGNIDRAKDEKTPTKQQALTQMAFDLSARTGTPFNEAMAEIEKPFKEMKFPTRIMLAALAAEVDVPNPFGITKEQAELIMKKLSKEAALGLFGALEEMGASFATPTWFERTFGRKLPFTGGKTNIPQDALDTVGTGQ